MADRLHFQGAGEQKEMQTVINTPKNTSHLELQRTESQDSSKRQKRSIANARRDRLVLEQLPLVRAIAVRVHENLPVHVDLDDLIHAGVLGLFDAASKYDPEKKVIFHSYA